MDWFTNTTLNTDTLLQYYTTPENESIKVYNFIGENLIE